VGRVAIVTGFVFGGLQVLRFKSGGNPSFFAHRRTPEEQTTNNTRRESDQSADLVSQGCTASIWTRWGEIDQGHITSIIRHGCKQRNTSRNDRE